MVSTGKKILATLVFWVFAVFGGIVPMLWNALSPHFAQYRQGDLGYIILQIVSNAIGAVIGVYIYNAMTDEKAQTGLMVNCIIGATVMGMLIIVSLLMNIMTASSLVALALEMIVFILCAVEAHNDTKPCAKD